VTQDLSNIEKKTVMVFRNEESGQEMMVEIHDRYPQLGDTHIEGRRYVAVSVELFIQMISAFGFLPVMPGQTQGGE
jgi:hypothetical protein